MRRDTTLRCMAGVTFFTERKQIGERVMRVRKSQRRSDKLHARRTTRSGARTGSNSPIVLVVDDTEDNRDLFAMVVTGLGYGVELAVDGIDGIERASTIVPSVILMDLAMPNMDGYEATRRIRSIPELSSVYIIAVTAFVDAASRAQAFAAGCDEVLAKPCAPRELAARIQARAGASQT